jgi:putative nucleotide binding protein
MSDAESDDGASAERSRAMVLDLLPNGRSDDDRPAHRKPPLAYALGESQFRLRELTLAEDADIGIGDRVPFDGDGIESTREMTHADLSNAARSELEYAVGEIIDRDEARFVGFYDDAQPITLRLHQLNLLPGIGKKLRNSILDERKRAPFEGFDDLEERVAGLHRPKEILVERLIEELRDDDLKYRIFVGRDPDEG